MDPDDPTQAAMLVRALVAVARSGASAEQLGWMALGRAEVLGAALADLTRLARGAVDLDIGAAAASLERALDDAAACQSPPG